MIQLTILHNDGNGRLTILYIARPLITYNTQYLLRSKFIPNCFYMFIRNISPFNNCHTIVFRRYFNLMTSIDYRLVKWLALTVFNKVKLMPIPLVTYWWKMRILD